MRIAIIGCGFIGRTVIEAVKSGSLGMEVACAFDADASKVECIGVPAAKNLQDLLCSDAELVVECASQRAVGECALEVLGARKNLMVMSVGALADDKLFEKLKSAAARNNVKMYLPSGAIGALDAVNSANMGRLKEVSLATRKPPASLGLSVGKETIVFEGFAREAVEKFPQNINVAATLSIAGIGFDRTKVRIVADPGVKRNVHEIRASGDFGQLSFRVENLPSKNPKTSLLAALSAIACLKKISSPVQIG